MFDFLLLSFLISSVLANDCAISPIYVDLHQRTIDSSSLRYGLFAGVGTPAQNLSLWPSISNDQTVLASSTYCGQNTSSDCILNSHGLFSPALSESFKAQRISRTRMTGDVVGTDTVNLFVHYYDPSPARVTKVENVSVAILPAYSPSSDTWFGPAGTMGLGLSSSLLQRLYDQKLISSRSFGLYMGTAYPRANGAINGSLTIGGYDAARFQEPVHKYPLDNQPPFPGSSPFKVLVRSITLNQADGKVLNIEQKPFDAYLTTAQYGLTLPLPATQRFVSATAATTANDGDNSLQLPPDYNATLTITLQDGFNVTFSSDWLRNKSNLSPLTYTPPNPDRDSDFPLQNRSSVSLFGTAFLSQVYLTASYDSSPPAFFLASAISKAPYSQHTALCPDQTPIASAPPSITRFAATGMVGAILGGVIGGLSVVAVAIWAIRKCMQCRQRNKNTKFDNDLADRKELDEEMSRMATINDHTEHILPKRKPSAKAVVFEDPIIYSSYENLDETLLQQTTKHDVNTTNFITDTKNVDSTQRHKKNNFSRQYNRPQLAPRSSSPYTSYNNYHEQKPTQPIDMTNSPTPNHNYNYNHNHNQSQFQSINHYPSRHLSTSSSIYSTPEIPPKNPNRHFAPDDFRFSFNTTNNSRTSTVIPRTLSTNMIMSNSTPISPNENIQDEIFSPTPVSPLEPSSKSIVPTVSPLAKVEDLSKGNGGRYRDFDGRRR